MSKALKMSEKATWQKLWEEFDDWFQEAEKPHRCSKCGQRTREPPDWEDQKQKIAKLVAKMQKKGAIP